MFILRRATLKIIKGFHLKNVRGDILGGITAAVVALPLALAFGNAALGPGGAIYGLYGAVVVGFLAALFGGTPAQVSGPTGPMSVTGSGRLSSSRGSKRSFCRTNFTFSNGSSSHWRLTANIIRNSKTR